jgi:hypothetical protein
MGQAKQRKSRLQRMLAEQPWCIYCGGTTAGNSIDHMPPTSMCDDLQRPAGMEFVCCRECHDGTRLADQVASLVSRMTIKYPGPWMHNRLLKMMVGLKNNQPEVFEELGKTETPPWLLANRARGLMLNGSATRIGIRTHERMLQFGARAALALHYHLTKKILPLNGCVFVYWYTNEKAIKGELPEFIIDRLPSMQTLSAGQQSLKGQFEYSSREMEDKRTTGHMITFRTSCAMQLLVAIDGADFAPLRSQLHPTHFYQPGFLKVLKTWRPVPFFSR